MFQKKKDSFIEFWTYVTTSYYCYWLINNICIIIPIGINVRKNGPQTSIGTNHTIKSD